LSFIIIYNKIPKTLSCVDRACPRTLVHPVQGALYIAAMGIEGR